MTGVDLDTLKQQIPAYLTAEDQRVLVEELRALSQGAKAGYTLGLSRDVFADVMLQGDGWTGFQLFIFESGERKSVRGMVLSNSCDIDPANHRDLPARILFAPLVRLSTFEDLLVKAGVQLDKVKDKIDSIRQQKVSNIFYIPTAHDGADEYIIRFDEMHSLPLAQHAKLGRKKLFTLSNTGFYMLAFKLSVHFCRLQERVQRGFARSC